MLAVDPIPIAKLQLSDVHVCEWRGCSVRLLEKSSAVPNSFYSNPRSSHFVPAQVTPGRDGQKGTRSAEFLAMNPFGQVSASICPWFRRLLQQPELARSQTRALLTTMLASAGRSLQSMTMASNWANQWPSCRIWLRREAGATFGRLNRRSAWLLFTALAKETTNEL